MRAVFIDLDGVVADFECGMEAAGHTDGQIFKHEPGAYIFLPPMPLAMWGVENVVKLYGQDNTFFLSKPPLGNFYAWSEKAMWVSRFFPHMERNLIITHNKAACGTSESVLIDDRLHKGHVDKFRGEVIHFGSPRFPSWLEVIARLRERVGQPAREQHLSS